jgi:lysine-N-methylase
MIQKTKAFRPEYGDKFRCIGPACEDSCCAGWQVDIDKATFTKYQSISAGPLGELIDANIARMPVGADGKTPSAFARINLLPSLECPFHNADGLCQIQVELGETYLSQTCATYPRRTVVIDKLADQTLSFSCPEVCRLVLLDPDVFSFGDAPAHLMLWDDAKHDSSLLSYLWPIREFVIGLIKNRTYPLWQRMFLLGTFSRRLEAVIRGEIKGGFSSMLEGFSAAVAKGTLRASIETIPADLTLQLGMVLELVKLRANQALQAPRLFECIDAFAKGIGYEAGATLQDMSTAYGAAHERYFAPFFDRNPHILENYLINMIFRRLTPLGTPANGKLSHRLPPEPVKEFALLATEFALVKGLLIGVAGGFGESFSAEHVVQTVQSVSKRFEHNPEFPSKVYHILLDKRLDNAHGLTMLLRN